MHWQYTPIVWMYLASALLAGSMTAYAWKRRAVPGAAAFALMQASAALWAGGYGLVLCRSDLPGMLFFANVAWTGAVIEVPACLALGLPFARGGGFRGGSCCGRHCSRPSR